MKTGMKWAVGALLGALVVAPAPAFALPQQMNVQGLLTDASGGAVDGTFTVKLTLYPGKTGSGSVWTETKTNVLVTTGLFDEIMGEDLLNPLLPAIFAENAELWLGIQIMAGPGVPNGGEAELPRNKLATVAYAFEASHAAKADAAKTADLATTANLSKDVQCSGPCISAAEVGFNYAASATQGGDALNALMLNGKDYDTLVAEITAAASKNLTIDQSNMPPNGLNEVSNGQITNQFVDKVTHSYDASIPAYTPGPPEVFNPLAIKDQNPQGTTDVIDFPDIGTAEKLTVSINITNSDLKTVKVTLTDPNFVTYTLYDKGGTSDNKNLAVSYPDPTQTLSGDLTTWVGQNPKGKWVLTVVDSGFLNNKNDGQINAWSVGIQTLSNKKVQVTGDLIVDGKLTGVSGIAMQGDTTITGKLTVSGLATFLGTDGLILPKGTTAQRPGSPAEALLRFNVTMARPEYYNGTAWRTLGPLTATGGVMTETGGNRIHTFLGNGDFIVTEDTVVDVLVVAGGGSGGNYSTTNANGGGGAGGVVYSTNYTLPAGVYPVTVGAGGTPVAGAGAGGTGQGVDGMRSYFGTLTAFGGGGGGATGYGGGRAGGSGGGASSSGGAGSSNQSSQSGPPGSTTVVYGNNGGSATQSWTGAGGGGAGGTGISGNVCSNCAPSGDGGKGIENSISGTKRFYAGGGGGGGNSSERAGDGYHGGGRGCGSTSKYGYTTYVGEINSTTLGSGTPNAVPNSGGGGGGGSYWAPNGGYGGGSGAGGSGIVIIRYPVP